MRKLIGYCPQYNAIFDTLSVEENIEYFARIKGIPERWRQQLIEDAIDKLGLEIHRKKAAGTLCPVGGSENRRRASHVESHSRKGWRQLTFSFVLKWDSRVSGSFCALAVIS